MLSIQKMKLKKATDEFELIKARKEKLESGLAIEEHGFANMGAAVHELTVADGNRLRIVERIEALSETLAEMTATLKLDKISFEKLICDDLVRKYCVTNYRDNITKFRRMAFKNKLNRHWDGEDGILYKEWIRGHATTSEHDQEKKSIRKKDDDLDEPEPEYNWDETDYMDIYKCQLYDRFLIQQLSIMSYFSN